MTKEIDRSRIYTAVNADEVPIGSMGIIADNIRHLDKLICGYYADEQTSLYRITKINAEYATNRFDVIKDNYSQTSGNLFYLISKPNDEKSKYVPWTTETFPLHAGGRIVEKDGSTEYSILNYSKTFEMLSIYHLDYVENEILRLSYQDLFDGYLQLDGAPCGTIDG